MCAHSPPVFKHRLKFRRPQQALAAGKPQSAGHSWSLNGQTMTALGTARINHCATSAGLHAHTETMGTLAAGNGRLISTFHFLLPLLVGVGIKSPEKTTY